MNTTRRMVLAAMLSALGSVILLLGSLADFLDLAAVLLASFLIVFAVLELRGPWPYLTYAVTALLAFLLLQLRAVVFEYALFGGIYPIMKYLAEKLPRTPSYLIKLGFFNLSVAAIAYLSFALLGMKLRFGAPHIAVLLVLCNAVFMLYDYTLTRLIWRYCISIRPRFRRLLK